MTTAVVPNESEDAVNAQVKASKGDGLTNSAPNGLPQRHEIYYFADGNVENVLFKLHRSFLCRNPEWGISSLLSPPSSGSEPTDGQSDDRPIILSGLEVRSFEKLVLVLYTTVFPKALNAAIITPDEWIEILRLCDQFSIDLMPIIAHGLAPKTVADVSDKDVAWLLAITTKYRSHFPRVFMDGLFCRLTDHKRKLGVAEARVLGAELLLSVAECREFLVMNGIPEGESRAFHASRFLDNYLKSTARV